MDVSVLSILTGATDANPVKLLSRIPERDILITSANVKIIIADVDSTCNVRTLLVDADGACRLQIGIGSPLHARARPNPLDLSALSSQQKARSLGLTTNQRTLVKLL